MGLKTHVRSNKLSDTPGPSEYHVYNNTLGITGSSHVIGTGKRSNLGAVTTTTTASYTGNIRKPIGGSQYR